MKIDWVDGFKISVQSTKDEVTISANKEGLLSLAKQRRKKRAVITIWMNIML